MNTPIQTATIAPFVTAPLAPLLAFAKATDEQIADFCDAILLGIPTGKILPASITDLRASGGITDAQLATIKAARRDHEGNADADRKTLMRLARTRRIKGARFNSRGLLTGLRFGDRTKN